jgi:ribosome-binding factor A
MQRSIKRDKIIEFVKHGVDLFLAQHSDEYGFSHVIDVNMSEDLKTAYIYFSCPVEKNEKTMENKIVKDRSEIFELFKESFSSKFMPRTQFICIKEENAEF